MKMKIVLSTLIAVVVASCGVTRERDGFGGGFGKKKGCLEECGTPNTTKVESIGTFKDYSEKSLLAEKTNIETTAVIKTTEAKAEIKKVKAIALKQTFAQKVATKMAVKAAAKIAPAKVKKAAAKNIGIGNYDDEILIAIILCIFVGILGIHRFYLGYNLIGVLQLVTLGGCGIWTLIDFIRLIIGDLDANTGDPWAL
jgi:hypothetical protein